MTEQLKRKSRGTPGLDQLDANFICGFCHNSGVAENKKGDLTRCPCGAGVVVDSR